MPGSESLVQVLSEAADSSPWEGYWAPSKPAEPAFLGQGVGILHSHRFPRGCCCNWSLGIRGTCLRSLPTLELSIILNATSWLNFLAGMEQSGNRQRECKQNTRTVCRLFTYSFT